MLQVNVGKVEVVCFYFIRELEWVYANKFFCLNNELLQVLITNEVNFLKQGFLLTQSWYSCCSINHLNDVKELTCEVSLGHFPPFILDCLLTLSYRWLQHFWFGALAIFGESQLHFSQFNDSEFWIDKFLCVNHELYLWLSLQHLTSWRAPNRSSRLKKDPWFSYLSINLSSLWELHAIINGTVYVFSAGLTTGYILGRMLGFVFFTETLFGAYFFSSS